MKDIAVVQVTDWAGIYVDGVLHYENHSLSARDVVEQADGDEAAKLSYANMEGTELDDQVADEGGFPEDLPDLSNAFRG